MKVFFDTISSFICSTAVPRPSNGRGRELLDRHTRAGETLLSTQILQEFYVAVTRKLATPLDPAAALEAVRELAVMPSVRVDIPLILSAAQLSRERQLSFWDAFVIRAAIEGGATTLYSEDLHSQMFETLAVVNPLR